MGEGYGKFIHVHSETLAASNPCTSCNEVYKLFSDTDILRKYMFLPYYLVYDYELYNNNIIMYTST